MKDQAPTSHEADCQCKECAARRNRFFRGKTLKAAEFRLEQEYGIRRRRLLTRFIAGWGVVRGERVEGPRGYDAEPGELKVTRGLAIDRHGREIALEDPTVIGANNTFLMEDGKGGCELRSVEKIDVEARYLLAIHYAEYPTGDAVPPDECGCDRPEKPFLCEGVLFSLTKLPDERCPCGESGCTRECGCGGDGECGEGPRNGRACLCQWTAKSPENGKGPWCCWHGYQVDPSDGVPLACVSIGKTGDKCNPAVTGRVIDDCRPRRILKSNDVLYDLIRGCDLTRIKSVSWGKWHRRMERVPWKEFVDILQRPQEKARDHQTRLAVTFTRPVQADTVTADCFSFTFTLRGSDTGWYETQVVPVTRAVPADPEPGDPPGTTRSATIHVTRGWYQEVTSIDNALPRGATVRIEVYGDFILDCNGQAVDANARGFALRDNGDGSSVAASGNGTPGGTFISVFRLEAPPMESDDTKHD